MRRNSPSTTSPFLSVQKSLLDAAERSWAESRGSVATITANAAAAADLLDFLGCTQFCGTVNATGRGFADWDGSQTVRPNYHTSGLGAGAATVSLFSVNKDLLDATAGHFLVKAVPVPAAVWLFGSGLLGLIGVARRKARV